MSKKIVCCFLWSIMFVGSAQAMHEEKKEGCLERCKSVIVGTVVGCAAYGICWAQGTDEGVALKDAVTIGICACAVVEVRKSEIARALEKKRQESNGLRRRTPRDTW